MKPICRNKDVCLALCQMNVLSIVLFAGGMDLDQAITALHLGNEKYARLAEIEQLPEIAEAIRKAVKADGQ